MTISWSMFMIPSMAEMRLMCPICSHRSCLPVLAMWAATRARLEGTVDVIGQLLQLQKTGS
jgi:hypothetical protein